MLHSLFARKCAHVSRFHISKLISLSGTLLCCAFIGSLLVACGSNTGTPPAAPASRYGAAPTATLAPTSTPTLVPTPTVTPTPTPQPPTPTPVPQGAPAVLDLQPSSMSFVGHLDCPGKSAYVCTAKVSSPSSNQSDLHWHAYNNISGQIVFSPASGVLAPGTSVLVKITIPFTACTQGLFFFQGPINTHTITWAC